MECWRKLNSDDEVPQVVNHLELALIEPFYQPDGLIHNLQNISNIAVRMTRCYYLKSKLMFPSQALTDHIRGYQNNLQQQFLLAVL